MQIAGVLISDEHDEDAADSIRGYAVYHQHRCGSTRWKRRGRVAEIIQNNVCLVPRLLISRMISSARKLRGRRHTKNRGVIRESKRGRSLGSVVTGEREDDNMLNSSGKTQVDCENLEDAAAGHNRTITYFNLAIGLCLLHLIVASKKEFSEMAKLRKKFELVVDQNAKEKIQSKDSSMFSLQSESNEYSCTTDAKEITTTSNGKLIGNPLYSEPMGLCDQISLTSTQTTEGNCIGRMDQLEIEMEFELERLQHFLDMEDASDHLNQQKTDQILFEDFSSKGSSNTTTSFRQSMDYPKSMNTSWGVNPIELDMKLHELVEMRQEERIKELETALSTARQNLYEKEQELCWWKDTARIMHQDISHNCMPHLF